MSSNKGNTEENNKNEEKEELATLISNELGEQDYEFVSAGCCSSSQVKTYAHSIKKEKFLKPNAVADLDCDLCKNIPIPLMLNEEGEIMCIDCLDDVEAKLKKDFKYSALTKRLENLEINCEQELCNQKLLVKDYKNHKENDCLFNEYTCKKHPKSFILLRKNLEKHNLEYKTEHFMYEMKERANSLQTKNQKLELEVRALKLRQNHQKQDYETKFELQNKIIQSLKTLLLQDRKTDNEIKTSNCDGCKKEVLKTTKLEDLQLCSDCLADFLDYAPTIAVPCICGHELFQIPTSKTYQGGQVNCDKCSQSIPHNDFTWHCPKKKSSPLHGNGFDLCQKCYNKEILNKLKKFSYFCTCGCKLEISNVRQCYNGLNVSCDKCNVDVPADKNVWHCPNIKTQHKHGFDICNNCARQWEKVFN